MAGMMTAANWPQYRGPNASGLDDSHLAPVEWNVGKGNNIAWQTPIPGLAHAAPIVWSNRVYVTTAVKPGPDPLKIGLYGDIDSVQDRDSQEWRLLALDRDTGAVVWNQLAHSGIPRVKRHTKATHCNSTPATDGQRIVRSGDSPVLPFYMRAE
jgi:outer membrane protein assembly factor BamB